MNPPYRLEKLSSGISSFVNTWGFSPAELVIMGFQGPTLNSTTAKNIQSYGFSHFILFAQNYESKAQLIGLTDDLQALNPHPETPLLVSADQEGGRVARFRKDFSPLPTARAVGTKASPNFAFELAKIQARELFAAGIQLNFAPVCDINTNPKNPVIGDRAYGETEEAVSRMVTAIVRGHLLEKVFPCLKHFPGHGDTNMDSHLALPSVDTELETLRQREWVPFHKGMKSGSPYLMSAHVLVKKIDPDFPGTFSKTFLSNHVRKDLMFQGLIVSDDMEMGAVTQNYGKEEAPILALEAGCDLLCYRSEEAAIVAVESITRSVESGRLDGNQLRHSVEKNRGMRAKIEMAQSKLSQQDRAQIIGNPEHLKLIQSFGF